MVGDGDTTLSWYFRERAGVTVTAGEIMTHEALHDERRPIPHTSDYSIDYAAAYARSHVAYQRNKNRHALQRENRELLEDARTQTASSSHPVLVNNTAEVARLTTDLDVYQKPYPLMTVERKDASVLTLLLYFVRLLFWRLFFSAVYEAVNTCTACNGSGVSVSTYRKLICGIVICQKTKCPECGGDGEQTAVEDTGPG